MPVSLLRFTKLSPPGGGGFHLRHSIVARYVPVPYIDDDNDVGADDGRTGVGDLELGDV